MRQFRFSPAIPETLPFTIGDGLILLAIASALYAGLRLAFYVPAAIKRPGDFPLTARVALVRAVVRGADVRRVLALSVV